MKINALPFRPQQSTARREQETDLLAQEINNLPDPVTGKSHLVWTNYHIWMLEIRGRALVLLRNWPDHAPIIKLQLAQCVYQKALYGQILNRRIENLQQAEIYDRTHPLLTYEEVTISNEDSKLNIIYAERQALLIAFIQLFEWLTQDDAQLVPVTPLFAGFKGRIRLPAHWLASMEQMQSNMLGMGALVASKIGESFYLPPRQFVSNILPTRTQVYNDPVLIKDSIIDSHSSMDGDCPVSNQPSIIDVTAIKAAVFMTGGGVQRLRWLYVTGLP